MVLRSQRFSPHSCFYRSTHLSLLFFHSASTGYHCRQIFDLWAEPQLGISHQMLTFKPRTDPCKICRDQASHKDISTCTWLPTTPDLSWAQNHLRLMIRLPGMSIEYALLSPDYALRCSRDNPLHCFPSTWTGLQSLELSDIDVIAI